MKRLSIDAPSAVVVLFSLSVVFNGVLESLDPGPALWTRKCLTLDRDFGQKLSGATVSIFISMFGYARVNIVPLSC